MAETDHHRDLMTSTITTLGWHYKQRRRRVYVSGNLLVYYVPGNNRRRVSPDVFVVRGISTGERECYLVWEEKKCPEAVIEITSKSTQGEDQGKKLRLYRDTLKVQEYFLFDPHGDYLKPNLQGYRLEGGDYIPIEPVDGRLVSKVLGLHLEQVGKELRLYDPAAGRWLDTLDEVWQKAQRAEQAEGALQVEVAAREQAEANRTAAAVARQQAETERQAELGRRLSNGSTSS